MIRLRTIIAFNAAGEVIDEFELAAGHRTRHETAPRRIKKFLLRTENVERVASIITREIEK